VTIGFPWHELKTDALIVDVGGGVGSASLALLNKFSTFRFVVQDLPRTVLDAKKVREVTCACTCITKPCGFSTGRSRIPKPSPAAKCRSAVS
jgi:hypothetical protein